MRANSSTSPGVERRKTSHRLPFDFEDRSEANRLAVEAAMAWLWSQEQRAAGKMPN